MNERDPAELGQAIARLPAHNALTAALDEWAEATDDAPLRARMLAVSRLADPQPWRDRLRDPQAWADRQALERLAGDMRPEEQSPQIIITLARRLKAAGGDGTALLRRGLAQHPRDFWLCLQLGTQAADPLEQIGCFQAALAIRPRCSVPHVKLGNVLRDRKDLAGAVAHFRQAIGLSPNDAPAHYHLAGALRDLGDLDGAITHYGKAIAADPNITQAYNDLGLALRDSQQLDDAIVQYRAAVKMDPTFAPAHTNLGVALLTQWHLDEALVHLRLAAKYNPADPAACDNLGMALRGKRDIKEAVAQYRRAIELEPAFALAHTHLGVALLDAGDVKGAVAQHARAIELAPKLVVAHTNLGLALAAGDDLDGAIAQFQKVIQLDPKAIDAYGHLARALLQHGDFAEARKIFVQLVKLAPASHPCHGTAPRQLKRCDELLVLDKQLTAFLVGGDAPEEFPEQLALAVLCRQYKRYFVTAARLYGSALDGEPKLAEDPAGNHRYGAACAAILAAADKGLEQRKAGTEEKIQLREHALSWLRADLDWFTKQAHAGNSAGVLLLIERLPHWLHDPELGGVRDAPALAALPVNEQAAWRKLWAEAGQLLKQVQAGVAETTLIATLADRERQHVHERRLEAGYTYVIDMHSTDLDSYLKLLDPAGKFLAENDGSASNSQDARLMVTPKADGTYRIVASSYRGAGRGTYTLTVRALGGKAR